MGDVEVWEASRGEEDRFARDWADFVAGRDDASCYHQYCWKGVIERAFGHRTPYLLARRNGRVTGCLPLCFIRSRLFGRYLVSLPFFNYGGVLAEDAESEAALLARCIGLAERERARHVEIRMTRPLGHGLTERTRKVVMELDLPSDSERLWDGFRPKLRSQIRRPLKAGAEVVFGGEERLDDFYAVFACNMRDLGTPVYAKAFFSHILRACPESTLAVVYLHGRAAAAGFLVGFRGRLEIPWASSLRRFNQQAPNMLLYWKALEWACHNGYTAFDFGRSSPDSGTYRFKAQWGAKPHPCHWHYWVRNGGPPPELNPANPRFRMAIQAWRRLPVAFTRLLGPAIVRNLP